jgi:hypothetical protein
MELRFLTKSGNMKLFRHLELIKILAFMSRILAVITNVLIGLVGCAILIYRSFSLILGFK